MLAVAMDLIWGMPGSSSWATSLWFALGGYVFGMHLMRGHSARRGYDAVAIYPISRYFWTGSNYLGIGGDSDQFSLVVGSDGRCGSWRAGVRVRMVRASDHAFEGFMFSIITPGTHLCGDAALFQERNRIRW
jgi:ABC-type branched-subunit amino acid transport system permease subunit